MKYVKSLVAAAALVLSGCGGTQPATGEVSPETAGQPISVHVINNLGSSVMVATRYRDSRTTRNLGRVGQRSEQTFTTRWDQFGIRLVVESDAERRTTVSNEIEALTPGGSYVLTINVQFKALLEERSR